MLIFTQPLNQNPEPFAERSEGYLIRGICGIIKK